MFKKMNVQDGVPEGSVVEDLREIDCPIVEQAAKDVVERYYSQAQAGKGCL